MIGDKLIEAIIKENDVIQFQKLNRSYFEKKEVELYDFVKSHLLRHKKFPTIDTIKGNGLKIQTADEPKDYFLKRIYERTLFKIIKGGYNEMTKSFGKNEMEGMIPILRKMLSEIKSVKSHIAQKDLEEMYGHLSAEYMEYRRRTGLIGVTTGWESLDEFSQGLQGGDLLVMVARPWQGKSWLLLQMALSAWKVGHRTLFVSMEMTDTAIIRRWFGIDADVNPKYVRSGFLSFWDEDKLEAKAEEAKDKNHAYFLAGNFQKTPSGLESTIDQVNPDIMYIDASYLMSPSIQNKYSPKHEQMSQVIHELKQLAVNRHIPIAITVQFNRKAQTSSTHRLDLKDIGGTDSVGQDADIVLGIRQPGGDYKKNYRIIECMKIREGDGKDFVVNFNFYPMDFGEATTDVTNNIFSNSDDNMRINNTVTIF